jgi:hypothetical protein
MRDLEIIQEAQRRGVSRPRTPSPPKPSKPLTQEQERTFRRRQGIYTPPNIFERGLQKIAGPALQLFEPLILSGIEMAGKAADAERVKKSEADRAALTALRAKYAAERAADKAVRKPKGGRMYCVKCKKGGSMCCAKCKKSKCKN